MANGTHKPSSCFLHVPKSAGSALTQHLQTALGKANVFHLGDSRHQHDALEMLLRRFLVVTGHFHVADIPETLFATTYFFTFLREPVDRIVSLYSFLKHGDVDHDGGQPVLGDHQDFEGVLAGVAGQTRCSAWSNWQTFLFSGATDAEWPAEELLPAALRNLARFDFVGLHEHFAEGVELLGRLRGWPLTGGVPRFKTTRDRPPVGQVDPAILARIRELNRCDARLYTRALELWEATRVSAAASAATGATVAAPVAPPPPAAPGRQQRAERGSREMTFNRVEVRDRRTGKDAVIDQGNPVEIRLGVYSQIHADRLTVGLRVSDEMGLEVYGITTEMLGRPLSVAAGGTLDLTFTFDLILAPGGYRLTVAILDADPVLHKVYHWIDDVTVLWCVRERPAAFVGLVDLRATLTVDDGAAGASAA